MKKTIIGLDLDREYTQITYYNERMTEPETVSIMQNQDRYLIPTPGDLFSLIEDSVELGLMTLANFLKTCLGFLKPAVDPQEIVIMITMKTMAQPWTDALRGACEMAGIAGENVFLQTHGESFCSYTLHQKKDLWMYRVALFEYEDTRITSYVMSIDPATKPALVRVTPGSVLDLGKRGARSEEEWNETRDARFLELIRETFQGERFSATYLIGDSFDKTWAVESLQFLCQRRHVFQGRNLYTKGACYAAMQRMGAGKNLDNYLYHSEDLVETNLSMRMHVRGRVVNYMLVGAGVNWYEADHTCEFITDGTDEIVIYGKSMHGTEAQSYSITLKGLPQRPGRTTRLQLQAKFIAANRCKVTIRDLGFGEFFAPSGLVWESVLEV